MGPTPCALRAGMASSQVPPHRLRRQRTAVRAAATSCPGRPPTKERHERAGLPLGPALHQRPRVGPVGDDGMVRIGITSFAQDALGDVVYVSLPAVGDTVTPGDSCGEVESTKSVSDVYAPLERRGDRHQRRARRVARAGQLRPVRRGLDVRAASRPTPRPSTPLMDASTYTAVLVLTRLFRRSPA